MATLKRTQWDIGIHKGDWEIPDIFNLHLTGTLAREETVLLVNILLDEVTPQVDHPWYLVTYMAPNTGAFSSEARKYLGTIKVTWAAVCIVGGTALGRAAMNIAIRAINLVSGNPIPSRLVKTKEEAYAFIDEMRAKNAKPAAAAHP